MKTHENLQFIYNQHPKSKKNWNKFVFMCDLPAVKTALTRYIGDEWMNKWKLFKNGGIGIVTIDVKILPLVYLRVNEMLEIDEILIDLDFSGYL